MPDITLHDLEGEVAGTLRIPTFDHPPRAVIHRGEVYVDLTRSGLDYWQVTVYQVPGPDDQGRHELDEAEIRAYVAGQRESGKVAGLHHAGRGV